MVTSLMFGSVGAVPMFSAGMFPKFSVGAATLKSSICTLPIDALSATGSPCGTLKLRLGRLGALGICGRFGAARVCHCTLICGGE